jgi:hypothetical protein
MGKPNGLAQAARGKAFIAKAAAPLMPVLTRKFLLVIDFMKLPLRGSFFATISVLYRPNKSFDFLPYSIIGLLFET